MGMVYQARGEFETALHHYQQSLDIEIKLDDRSGIASSLHQIAMIHYLRGEYEVALQQFQDALKIKRRAW
ncbi:MAG: tetratricopeptide repeat protein [Acidobacteriota bacterium]